MTRRKRKKSAADSRKNARPSWPPLRGGSARRRWGREPCGCPEYFGSRLAKNFCRDEHCSPVPACLTRKLSRKMRCGGKLAGDQWSPLHTQQGKNAPPSPPVKKPQPRCFVAKQRGCVLYPVCHKTLRISCTRSAITMGLDRKPFMPHSRALRRSSSKAFAVMARMGMPARAGFSSSRMRRVAV